MCICALMSGPVTVRSHLHRTIGLTDYYQTISDGLTGYRTRVRVKGPIVPVSPIVRCIIKCDPSLCVCLLFSSWTCVSR